MASNVEGVQGSYHACKCLNIRVRPSHPKDEPPDVATTPEYTQVYVAEDGITVVSIFSPRITVDILTPWQLFIGASPVDAEDSYARNTHCRHLSMLSIHILDLLSVPGPRISRVSDHPG